MIIYEVAVFDKSKPCLYTVPMNTFVIGDIHGTHRALLQCLERSGFDAGKDLLIVLGDVCDGYPEVDRCINELLKIKHCEYVIGNHDLWVLDWAKEGKEPEVWTTQGGLATIFSYGNDPMPKEHIQFLEKAHPCFVWDEKVFVHGGFDPNFPLKIQGLNKFAWDRELLFNAQKKSWEDKQFKFSKYKEIFVGHTPTIKNFSSTVPVHFCNVWALDTGAGYGECLTIMDINSKQFWQSDATAKLYEGIRGR